MTAITDKTILITGASSGIGEGTARVLGAAGATLVLGAPGRTGWRRWPPTSGPVAAPPRSARWT
ncbi:hypothetical protein [Azospirillum baldaniorum]|uniref:hypothetical protein n=1 Tax=Azospirillum baldaniorum TaxID=1064539 RepID=UPI003F716FF8